MKLRGRAVRKPPSVPGVTPAPELPLRTTLERQDLFTVRRTRPYTACLSECAKASVNMELIKPVCAWVFSELTYEMFAS